jgi:hypothetical protein
VLANGSRLLGRISRGKYFLEAGINVRMSRHGRTNLRHSILNGRGTMPSKSRAAKFSVLSIDERSAFQKSGLLQFIQNWPSLFESPSLTWGTFVPR